MIEFRKSWAKQLGLLVVAVLLIWASVFAATSGPSLFHRVVGWLGVALFGCSFVVVIRGVAETGVVVRMDDAGVHDSRIGTGTIPWEQILAWSVVSIRGTRFLALSLREPHLFLTSALSKRVARVNAWLGCGDVAIGFTGLTPSIDRAVEFVRLRVSPEEEAAQRGIGPDGRELRENGALGRRSTPASCGHRKVMTSVSDRIALVSSGLWAVLVGVLCTDAGIGIFSLFAFLLGGAALVALWVIRLAFHLLRNRGRERSPKWKRLVLEPLFVALVALLVLSGAAFQVRFQASRPFLQRYVRSFEAGTLSVDGRDAPTLVGLFVIREVERHPGGVVRMITTTCSFDHCGLAYSPTGAPPVVGEDSYRSLGGGWWKWWRSW